jgi:hypothetical protein
MTSSSNIAAAIRHDSFAAIAYEKRRSANGSAVGIELDGHFVFRWFVQEVWNHVCAGVTTANPYRFHSSEGLFNDPVRWKDLEKQFHIAAGRCLAYFVRQKMLPLQCVNPEERNKLYALTIR